MKILLSIKPEFAEKIFIGSKKFEFRKVIFKNKSVKTVVVYVTRPIGKIVGEFDISEIIYDEPNLLWNRTQEFAGITKEFFEAYFRGRERGFALAIGDVRKYDEPVSPDNIIKNFTPPQSFIYLDGRFQKISEEGKQLLLL
jgi:predicted transcriptional regulator